MLRRPMVLAVLVSSLAVPAAGQSIWYVDDDAPKDPGPGDPSVSDPGEDGSPERPFDAIQEAVDASTNGDQVLVLDGRYTGRGNRAIYSGQKAFTIRSLGGPTACVIDCERRTYGFYLTNWNGPPVVLDGFRIENGYTWNGDGGGVNCSEHATITNCIITGCEAGGGGGAVYCGGEHITLAGCSILGNVAGAGGGVYFTQGDLEIIDCVIAGNRAGVHWGAGGGVLVYEGSVTITNCSIERNRTAGSGGAVYAPSLATVAIAGTRMVRNVAGGSGGAVSAGSSVTLSSCVIAENISGAYGGGIYFANSEGSSVTNCLILHNKAGMWGGGMRSFRSDPDVTNCTFSGNVDADGAAGALYCDWSGSRPTLANCVLWHNTPPEITGLPSVTYSDIEGGYDGAGNIDAAPGFALRGDYRLTTGSPCVDAGTNGPPGGLPPVDIEGTPRPLPHGGTSDMGAYELDPTGPTIALSATDLFFTSPTGGPAPPDQTLIIRNAGIGELDWRVGCDCEWAKVVPPAGTSTGEADEVTVSVEKSGLPVGDYPCRLAVSAPGAVNSPRVLNLRLRIGAELHVPEQYPSIKAAIGAAVDGDVVVLADGEHEEWDLDFLGKAITVRSCNGPENCIIDCWHDGRGFYFRTGERGDSVLQGITIRDGRVYGDVAWGGGIYCDLFTSPQIIDCVISENRVVGDSSALGAGIFCYLSAPTIKGCVITANSSEGDWAGGGGGGIGCVRAAPRIVNCTITDNEETTRVGGGAGVMAYTSDAAIINCLIAGNIRDGVGFSRASGIPWGDDRDIGAIHGTLITGHVLAVSSYYYQPRVSNCTVTGNIGTDEWGGGFSGAPTIANSIVWGNSPYEIYPAPDKCSPRSGRATDAAGHGVPRLWADRSARPATAPGGRPYATVTYSLVGGAWEGEGNIDTDPLFADADGADNDTDTWADNDYRLMLTSPCVNAGHNGVVPADVGDVDDDGNTAEPVPVDLDGNARFFYHGANADPGSATPPTVDMGAYELNTLRLFVDADAPGANDGSSWPGAYRDLQDALAHAAGLTGVLTDVWVARGTYTPDRGTGDRTETFLIPQWTALYGGFAADDTALTERNWIVNETILSGNIGQPDLPYDNSNHVVTTIGANGSVRLDGFTIRDGFAVGNPWSNRVGAGMFNDGGAPMVSNCCLMDNWAMGAAGMFNWYSGPTMIGCTFRENISYHGAGAITTYYGSPLLINCIFRDNQAGDGVGGAMGTVYGDLSLTNCVFVGNSASSYGGALFNSECGVVTLTNCTFTANTAPDGEALGFESDEQPPSTVELANCILWNSGNEIWNSDGSAITITYSDVRGGWPGEGNIDADPLLAGDGVHLIADSPCRNAGDPLFMPVDVKVDIDGQPRVLEGRVDMGADELQTPRRALAPPRPVQVDPVR